VEFPNAGSFFGKKLGDAKAGGMGKSLDDCDAVHNVGRHYLAKMPNTFFLSKEKSQGSETVGF
jgi:hypothetical protein|tara:strand:- start:581 stop:769 length:189 start_codon:yes stop_codon:yes gene_type:complete